MAVKKSTRSFLLFLPVAVLGAVLTFLLSSQFFTSWDGTIVSTAAPTTERRVTTHILTEDGQSIHPVLPVQSLRGHDLPVDERGRRTRVPDGAPLTKKSRYQLSFLVQAPEGEGFETYPTTSVVGINFGLLTFVLLALGRNMILTGSPVRLEPVDRITPSVQAPAGQVAQPKRQNRSKKGPPPQRRRSRRR